MRLSELLPLFLKRQLSGGDAEFLSLATDSRRVQPGALFFAIPGYTVDGHEFVRAAAARGAVAAVVEKPQDAGVPQLIVPDTRLASAIIADRFYGSPSQKLKVIGVTGTNGKTTTTHLIERVLRDAGQRTGLLGTIGKRIGDVTEEVVNTTPEAVELQGVLAQMVDAQCDYVVMEVSSHALEERRVAGTLFQTAVFTNLTQDHLDFHHTMENYRAAKGKLFARLGNTYALEPERMARSVLNADDPASSFLDRQGVHECLTYGIEHVADVRASNLRLTPTGASFRVTLWTGETQEVEIQLTGRFNVYNALAAIGVGLAESVPLNRIAAALGRVSGIPGRLERVDAGQAYAVLVDYSHTPDSLENALLTVREFTKGRVICVVGCGGDRDRGKRPLMAQVALEHSDVALFTSDNPRTEDPERILDDMEAGARSYSGQAKTRYERITERRRAIARAIELAGPQDAVLIAGKGHETYQVIGHTKHHFDDRETARELILAADSKA